MPAAQGWIAIRPNVVADARARRLLRDCVRRLVGLSPDTETAQSIARIREEATVLAGRLPTTISLQTLLCASILCDLRAQGWQLRLLPKLIEVAAPPDDEGSVEARKAQIRAAHLIERDAQLCQPSVRRFVRRMERRRLYKGEWQSVFSLMRDGRELANSLRMAAEVPAGPTRLAALQGCIDPYVQVVTPDAVCQFTGIRLLDVWRYFRHTWNTAYLSTPGRKVWFLVRDRAALNHPVLGIGALGSSIVQLAPRDRWIGWKSEEFLTGIRARPTVSWARWLESSLAKLIADIHVADFRAEGVVSKGDLARPTKDLVLRLRELAADEWRVHRLYPDRQAHKAAVQRRWDADWKAEARAHLFRAKRAEHLAELLEARRSLLAAGFRQPTAAALRRALGSKTAAHAIVTVLRYVKAVHVGVDMMDITICGAVAPYNALLGGKLVGLLMASPEVAAAYCSRYNGVPSIIASSMAGRPIRRRPTLAFLGTTSLYGVASSQYNRLRMPAEIAGGRVGDELVFIPVGKTVGFGSFHFSRDTMRSLEVLLARKLAGRPVNSIFGEGVNPKLRKVRSALDLIGLPSDLLLQHGSPRIIYAVPLARNFREVLMGRASRATPIIPIQGDTSARITEFWRERWLARRIERAQVLTAVAGHSLAYPVRHGARVILPTMLDEEGPLFAETLEAPVKKTYAVPHAHAITAMVAAPAGSD